MAAYAELLANEAIYGVVFVDRDGRRIDPLCVVPWPEGDDMTNPMLGDTSDAAEKIARALHDALERGYVGSTYPWDELHENERNVLLQTAEQLLKDGVVTPGPRL